MVINPLYSGIAGIYTNAMRAAVSATNIANANTYGYKAVRATIEPSVVGLPEVKITERNRPNIILPSPEGLPEGEKFMQMSNVDLTEEFVQMKIASYGYRANASVIRAQDEMIGTILDIMI